MLCQSSNIGARSATLAWGQPLRLRPLLSRLRASHVTFRDYYNKRNSLNISLGQKKSTGALPAYIHDNAIRMMAIMIDNVGKSKERDPRSVCAIL